MGLTLEQIRVELASLPDARTPTASDWARLSRSWKPLLQARIEELERLRDTRSSCIGCGCLSLGKCGLYNPGDAAARKGPGARCSLGDRSSDVVGKAASGGEGSAHSAKKRATGVATKG